MSEMESIRAFLNQKNIAVAGVSRKKSKFGNAIFKELSNKGYNLYPVNPNMQEYEGKRCYPDINSLPEEVTGIVINTRDEITQKLVADAGNKGIRHIWLQQGSLSKKSLEESWIYKENTISGHCILMFADPKGIHGFHKWLKKSFGKFPN